MFCCFGGVGVVICLCEGVMCVGGLWFSLSLCVWVLLVGVCVVHVFLAKSKLCATMHFLLISK